MIADEDVGAGGLRRPREVVRIGDDDAVEIGRQRVLDAVIGIGRDIAEKQGFHEQPPVIAGPHSADATMPIRLRQCKKGGFIFGQERRYLAMAMPQQGDNLFGRAIAEPDPDHFWGRTVENAELMKILVLADNYEPMLACVMPNCAVGRASQFQLSDMSRAGINIGQGCAQSRGQVLVE